MRSPGIRLSFRVNCFLEEILKAKQITECHRNAAVRLILTTSYVRRENSVSVYKCVSPPAL